MVGRDAVWVVNPDQTVSQINPRTRRVQATIADVRANGIAAGDLGVWVVESGGVAELDPTKHRVAQRIVVAAESLAALAVGADAIWVADPVGGSVWRIEPGPKPVLRQIPLAFGVHWIAATPQAIWATNAIADEVYRIDPRTNKPQVVNRMAAPGGIAVGDDGVWVTTAGRPSVAGPLPRSSCAGVDAGGAHSPKVMVVSDLPLQGFPRCDHRRDGGRDPLRAEATRVQGRSIQRRVSVMRRLDGPDRVVGRVQMRPEREGVHASPGRGGGDRCL